MALPSQMEQSGSSGRGHVYARQRRGGKPLVLVIGALVVVGAAAGVWKWKGSFAGSPATSRAVEPAPAAVTPESKPSAGKSAVPPVSLAPRKPVVKEPAAPVTPVSPVTGEKPLTLQQGTGGAEKPETAGPLTRAVERSTTPGDTAGGGQADHPKPAPVDLSRPDGRPEVAEVEAPAPAALEAPIAASGSTEAVRVTIEAGDRRLASGDLVEARVLYSRALADSNAAREDRERLRGKLAQINQDLLFSPKVVAGDPLVESYTVQGGDSLVKIARKRDLAVDWRLIQRVNAMSSPNLLREGQKLKLVRGPFHAVVHKGEYRLDLYSGAPDDPANWVFIRSFRVGLGANDTTPAGDFVVRPRSKLVNPPWTNPQTGERYSADDPKNPIGEHWIGIEGVGESKKFTGFGLHGTIEPDSVGQQKSMGCVRLGSDDIALLYEVLKEGVSVVKIEA